MTGISWFFVVAAVGVAGVDIWAMVEGRRDIERLAKPAATVLLALALVGADGDVSGRWWVILGLVVAAGGDYLLFLNRFLQGVGAFTVAQVAFVLGLTQRSPGLIAALIGLAVVAVFLMEFGRPLLAAAQATGRSIGRAVHVYLGALATLVAMGFATRSPLAAAGVSTFAASDSLVAWRRLIAPESWMPVASRVLYRAGLVMLVVSFA